MNFFFNKQLFIVMKIILTESQYEHLISEGFNFDLEYKRLYPKIFRQICLRYANGDKEKAKKYLKQYPSREVAAWLNKVTGRYISHVGLLSRIKHEQYHQTKASTLRSWAAKYRKAIEEAERHEKRLGGKATRQARAVLNRIDGGDECEEYW